MVDPGFARIQELSINGWGIILAVNQLDLGVTRITHRQSHIRLGRATTVALIF